MPLLAIDRQTGILIGLAALAVSAALVSWGAWVLLRRERRAARDAGVLPADDTDRGEATDATVAMVDLGAAVPGSAVSPPAAGGATGEAPAPEPTGTPVRSSRGARARRR